MCTFIHSVMLIGILAICGCVSPKALPAGKQVLWLGTEPHTLVAKLGYESATPLWTSHSSAGDRLFVQFTDTAGTRRGVIVSTEEIQVRELPGSSAWLDNEGRPAYWYDERSKNWQFAGGYILPTNMGVLTASAQCDGKFVPLFKLNKPKRWISSIEAGFPALAELPARCSVRQMTLLNDRLHVFILTNPDTDENVNGESLLKHMEYKIGDNKLDLLGVRRIAWAKGVIDFDPENHLLLVRPRQTYFAHGWLLNLRTGDRKRLGFIRGDGMFLDDRVIQQFRHALSSTNAATSK
jgi:hypothetical protein